MKKNKDKDLEFLEVKGGTDINQIMSEVLSQHPLKKIELPPQTPDQNETHKKFVESRMKELREFHLKNPNEHNPYIIKDDNGDIAILILDKSGSVSATKKTTPK